MILSPGQVLRVPITELKPVSDGRPAGLSTLAEAEREHILRALEECSWVLGGPRRSSAPDSDYEAHHPAIPHAKTWDRQIQLEVSSPSYAAAEHIEMTSHEQPGSAFTERGIAPVGLLPTYRQMPIFRHPLVTADVCNSPLFK